MALIGSKWLQSDLDIKDTNEDRDQIKNYIGSIWRKLQNAIFLMEQATNVCVNEQSCNNDYSDVYKIRALDAYTDAILSSLHDSYDILAKALCNKYHLKNRKSECTFNRMFYELKNKKDKNEIEQKIFCFFDTNFSYIHDNITNVDNNSKHEKMNKYNLYVNFLPDNKGNLMNIDENKLINHLDELNKLPNIVDEFNDLSNKLVKTVGLICDAIEEFFNKASE